MRGTRMHALNISVSGKSVAKKESKVDRIREKESELVDPNNNIPASDNENFTLKSLALYTGRSQ